MHGKRILSWILYPAALTLLVACTTSPLGRQQLQIVSNAQMEQMGVAAYQDIKQKTPISDDAAINGYVRCIADAIIAQLDGKQRRQGWEVTVFEADQANAFALPGGKIGVYTGLLDVAETPDQLAAVVAHEVAHVLASHGNERVSTSYVTQAGLDLVAAIAGEPSQTKNTALALLGLGAQVGILLPYSRAQESEADLLGLDMMAKAGFDPRASVDLWRNMQKAGGGAPPEFLSTHPSGQTRISDLQNRMDDTMKLYRQAQDQGRDPNCQRPGG